MEKEERPVAFLRRRVDKAVRLGFVDDDSVAGVISEDLVRNLEQSHHAGAVSHLQTIMHMEPAPAGNAVKVMVPDGEVRRQA